MSSNDQVMTCYGCGAPAPSKGCTCQFCGRNEIRNSGPTFQVSFSTGLSIMPYKSVVRCVFK